MDRCCLARALLACLTALLLCPHLRAAGVDDPVAATVLTGESLSAARRLEAAAKLAADKIWSEALDDYLHILETNGDVLVPLEAGANCSQQQSLVVNDENLDSPHS